MVIIMFFKNILLFLYNLIVSDRKFSSCVMFGKGLLYYLFCMLQGEDHLQNLHNVEQFVLDEADRMIEKGHFEELDKIVGFLNS